jgi:hypothetical protein
MRNNIHLLSYLLQFFLGLEKFQKKFVQKIKTHVLFSVTFSSQIFLLPMRISRCVPKATNTFYRNMHTYFWSTATMDAMTLLNITLSAPCLSYFISIQ